MSYAKKWGAGLFNFDPRTKIIVLILCIIIASIAPSVQFECLLIGLIVLFGCINGKIKYAFTGAILFAAFFAFSNLYLTDKKTCMVQTMFLAWMGLFYKVYPCSMLAGIILSTTKVNEFLSAMGKAHVSQKIVIPLAVMLRYIPTVREDWKFIKDAMELRDVSPSFSGFLKNPGMTIECLYVPLMMVASKTADELSVAALTRGIENPEPRTCLVQIKFRLADLIALLCFTALLIGAISL